MHQPPQIETVEEESARLLLELGIEPLSKIAAVLKAGEESGVEGEREKGGSSLREGGGEEDERGLTAARAISVDSTSETEEPVVRPSSSRTLASSASPDVQPSTTTEPPSTSSPWFDFDPCVLICENLPIGCKSSDIVRRFGHRGALRRILLRPSDDGETADACITFDTPEGAEMGLRNHLLMLGARQMTVRRGFLPSGNLSPLVKPPSNPMPPLVAQSEYYDHQHLTIPVEGATELHIQPIPPQCSTQDLRQTFEPYGIILNTRTKTGKHGRPDFGFVDFESSSDARRAKIHMDRTNFFGIQINVVFSRFPPQGGSGANSTGSSRPSKRAREDDDGETHETRFSPHRQVSDGGSESSGGSSMGRMRAW